MNGPTACCCGSRKLFAIHHPVGDILRPVIRNPLGDGRRKLRALAKCDTENALGQRRGDAIKNKFRVPLGGSSYALDQFDCLVEWESLPLAVVRNFWEFFVHEFNASAIEKVPILIGRHEHGPTSVIRHSYDSGS